MLLNDKEIVKQKMDRTKINAFVCCAMDIEKGDLNRIVNRVILNAKDRFEWNDEIEEYIIERSLMTQEVN